MDGTAADQRWIAQCAAAEAAGEAEDWVLAAALWNALRADYPHEPLAWRKAGAMLRAGGALDEAEAILAKGVERFPDELWMAYEAAIVAQRRGDWRSALIRAEGIARRFPEIALGPVLQGEALRALGRFEEAGAVFAAVIAQFPGELWAHYHYARLAADRREWAEALRRWETMLGPFPDYEPALLGKVRALYELDREDEGEAILSDVLDRHPGHAEALSLRAALHDPQRQIADEVRRRGLETSLPLHMANPEVLIEITSICNFACDYCVSPMKLRDKKQMSMETFRHVLAQVAEMTTNAVRLHVDGEPTSHPRFKEMALLVNSYGLQIYLATNGSRLDPTYLDIWMDPLISMSTSVEELVQRHKRLNFERYIARIADYTRAWAQSASRQNLAFQIVYYPQDTAEAEKTYRAAKDAFLTAFAQRAGLYEHCVEDSPIDSDTYRFIRKDHPAWVAFMKQPLSIGGLYPSEGKFVERKTATAGFCDAPWRQLAIHSDGSVGACCVDLSGGTTFATPDETMATPLKELWTSGPRLVSMRENFLQGRVEREVCRRCLNQGQIIFAEESR